MKQILNKTKILHRMDDLEEELYVDFKNSTNISSLDYVDYDIGQSWSTFNYWDLIPTAIVYGLSPINDCFILKYFVCRADTHRRSNR